MSRIAACILLSFVALAFVALALIVNWAKTRTRTLGADRAREAHRHTRAAAFPLIR
jgi:hypothetical protein